MKLIATISTLVLCAFTSQAFNRNWTNTLGGNWFVPANWSPNGVPTGVDVANITNNGTYTVTIATGTVAVVSYNIGGASGTQTLAMQTANSVTGAGTVRANGILDMSSGSLLGTLVVQLGGQLQFNTAANKFLDTLNLINQGTVTWNAGQLLNGGQPATVVSNGGQWLMTGDYSFNAYSGQTNTPVWINTGLLRKSAGAGFSQINNFNVAFNPGGVVDVQSGTLRFSGGTNNTLGSSFTASAGAVLDLNSGTYYDAGGVASGTGFNRFNGTTLNLRTNIIPGLLHSGGTVVLGPNFQNAGAITDLTLDGSTLVGSNRVSGTFVVNSGYLVNRLTILPGGELQFNTAANKFLDTLNLINQGTVTWNAGQLLNGGQPATVVSNGGQWLMTGDYSFNAYSGQTNTPVWINTGLLRKSAGAGFSQINNFIFNTQPSGVIQADTGFLRLPSGTTNTAGILRVNGGQLEANGTLTMAGGTLEGTGSVGANLLAGGNIAPGTNGPGLLTFPSSLNLRSGATLTLAGTNTSPGTYDRLSVVGIVALTNATLQVTSLPSVPVGTSFVIITNDGADAVQGTFAGLPESSPISISGQQFVIHYAGGSGNDVTLVRGAGSAGAQLMSGGFTNGNWRVLGLGNASTLIGIQATTNFVIWTNIGTVASDGGGNFNFTDSNAFQFKYRFYRTTN